ncbi:MAG: CHRD domain-containing protein [Phycisphaeraceae bacterium]|nr:CHRD domain-containing protein [Phycisphaeraceae bacterium]
MTRQAMFLCAVGGLAMMLAGQSARAATNFAATLTGAQEVNPVVSEASGIATLVLNDAQTALTISVTLFGLDLDGLQTPDNNLDNVTAMHIHAAPFGMNGGVVFGFVGPSNDLDADLVIDPVAGTVTSEWDLNEGNNTTLAAQLTNLLNDGLYLNVHTVAHAGGEIRGQIVPEPAGAGILAVGALMLRRRRPALR